MPGQLDQELDVAVHRICGSLLDPSSAGPSAVAIGVSDARADVLALTRGHARTLDDAGQPMTPLPLSASPIFDVGSVTKVVITTSLCMSLVDAGRMRLDEPVATWFGDFRSGEKRRVTVRDLLEHRAGLWEWWPTYVDGARTEQDAAAAVEGLPLRYRPGSGRHYSDLGFMLLGEIIAREFGEPLEVVAARELCSPLGMVDSGYRPRGAKPAEGVVATSLGDWYERRMVATGTPYPVPVTGAPFGGWRDHTLVGEANDGNCWHAFAGVSGHAGLFTSAPDLMRWGRALLSSLRGEGPWSAAVVEEFFRPARDPGQGLGYRVTAGGFVWHPGFPGARVAVLPSQRRVAVLLTNRLHTGDEPVSIDDAWSELVRAVEVA